MINEVMSLDVLTDVDFFCGEHFESRRLLVSGNFPLGSGRTKLGDVTGDAGSDAFKRRCSTLGG